MLESEEADFYRNEEELQWLQRDIVIYIKYFLYWQRMEPIGAIVLFSNYCVVDLKEAQVQFASEAERQRLYYDHKANTVSLELGDLVLAKANAYKRRRKVKDWWEEEPYKVECRIDYGIPSHHMKSQWTGHSWVFHWNWLFSHYPPNGNSFMFRCMGWVDKLCHHHPGRAYLESR